jgi:putative ABC transport system substrate-binding protein
MRRREFIAGIAGTAAAWPLVARAQHPFKIGYLGLTSPSGEAEMLASFREGLKVAGFEEGRDATIELRFAEGDVSRLPALADDLLRRDVTVLLAGTTAAAVAAKNATSTVPIVFVIGADPIKSGLVGALNHPGANITGISFFTNQMESKRLGLLHELTPKATLIGVLLNPNNPFFDNQVKDVDAASRTLGIKIAATRTQRA